MSEKIFNDLNIFNELVNDLINDDQEKGVSDKIQTEDVLKKLDISLSENGIDDETFKNSLKEIILNTPKTSSKLFFNQLFGGLNSKSVIGDLLSVLLNNSMATYKIAPSSSLHFLSRCRQMLTRLINTALEKTDQA